MNKKNHNPLSVQQKRLGWILGSFCFVSLLIVFIGWYEVDKEHTLETLDFSSASVPDINTSVKYTPSQPMIVWTDGTYSTSSALLDEFPAGCALSVHLSDSHPQANILGKYLLDNSVIRVEISLEVSDYHSLAKWLSQHILTDCTEENTVGGEDIRGILSERFAEILNRDFSLSENQPRGRSNAIRFYATHIGLTATVVISPLSSRE